MVTAIIPKKEEMLSVKEIGEILAEPLRECGATVAYLGGEYVRADRNGDIRRGDELFLFVESQGLPDERVDKYEHFRPVVRLAENHEVRFRLSAYTPDEIESAGGLERLLRAIMDDWEKIL